MKKIFQITDAGRKELEAELLELKGRRGDIASTRRESRSPSPVCPSTAGRTRRFPSPSASTPALAAGSR